MELNKRNVKIIIGLIVFTVLFIGLVNNLSVISIIFDFLTTLMFPFLIGGCIAFIINVPMKFIENNFIIKVKFLRKIARPLALVITVVIVLASLVLVGYLIIPEIITTLITIVEQIPATVTKLSQWADKLFKDNADAFNGIADMIKNMSFDWKKYLENIVSVVTNNISGLMTGTIGFLKGTISVVYNVFISIVFSIYILCRKEKLSREGKQLVYAFLPEKAADKLVDIMIKSYNIFKNFIAGQCTEAVILGTMFFIVLSIFKMPYEMLISVLIAVTALIPIFGAFIGCFIGAFLIAFINPMQAVTFVIIFLILQQVEGNLIYPHVVGNSVGLPSIWVLMAVTVGGSLMGVLGMLIFIPIVSVIYSVLRELVYYKLETKKIDPEKWGEIVEKQTAVQKEETDKDEELDTEK